MPATITTSLLGDRAVALRDDGASALGVEHRGPSASEQAAAAVGARLEAILSDEAPAPSIPAAAESAPLFYQPATEPASMPEPEPFQLTPEEPSASPPAAEPTDAQPEPAAEAEPSLFDPTRPPAGGSLFNLGGFSTSAAEVDLETQQVSFADAQPHVFGSIGLLVSLGLLGLALFGGGILWNLSVAANQGLSPVRMFGWGASVIGIICFATSAYLLMRRLADPDPLDED
jgi:lysozyme